MFQAVVELAKLRERFYCWTCPAPQNLATTPDGLIRAIELEAEVSVYRGVLVAKPWREPARRVWRRRRGSVPMDARTVLTANSETVYALAPLNLKADGPTVVEAPAHRLGFLQDGLQRYRAGVDLWALTRATATSSLSQPPGFTGTVPEGYFISRSPTYSVALALRFLGGGRQHRSGGRADKADQDLSARMASLALLRQPFARFDPFATGRVVGRPFL